MAAASASPVRLAGVLFVVCLASGALLVGFDQVTRPMIEKNQAAKTKRARQGVLPEGTVRVDQKPPAESSRRDPDASYAFTLDFSDEWGEESDDLTRVLDREQERKQAIQVFRGYDEDGDVTGYALVCELPDGYSGDIRFILGVRYDPEIDAFRVAGSKILAHKETPGLGAKISEVDYAEAVAAEEGGRDPVPYFLSRFEGRTYEEIGLKKGDPEGDIESLTAATITSRAFAKAVRRVLEFCNRNEDEILHPASAPPRGAPSASSEGPTTSEREG